MYGNKVTISSSHCFIGRLITLLRMRPKTPPKKTIVSNSPLLPYVSKRLIDRTALSRAACVTWSPTKCYSHGRIYTQRLGQFTRAGSQGSSFCIDMAGCKNNFEACAESYALLLMKLRPKIGHCMNQLHLVMSTWNTVCLWTKTGLTASLAQ